VCGSTASCHMTRECARNLVHFSLSLVVDCARCTHTLVTTNHLTCSINTVVRSPPASASRAPFSLLPKQKKAFYRASAAAEAASKQEWDAAVTIQRHWRGHAARTWVKHARASARSIEAAYIDWKQRKTEREAKLREFNERRYNAYHGGATKLQALWRGYRSRTDIFDFRSRAR
jgi:hypothetical protein